MHSLPCRAAEQHTSSTLRAACALAMYTHAASQAAGSACYGAAGAPRVPVRAVSELATKTRAVELGERLHVGLVRLLVGEAYEAVSTYLMSTTPLPVNK